MPEGDTIHKIARAMQPRLPGRALEGLWLRDRGWLARLAGQHVHEIAPLGKHLLVAIGAPAPARPGWVLHVHLGMHGRWHRHERGAAWSRPASQAVVRIAVAGEEWVCSRAARAEILRAVDLALHPTVSRLGPDLLGEAPRLEDVLARARRREPRSAAGLLLDQRVACGIGNVYKNEVLFLEGVHPRTPVAALSDARILALFRRARSLMQANLGGGRRNTLEPGRPVRRGDPRFWVYGRGGLPCRRCAVRLRGGREGDAARATWWCEACQPRAREGGVPLSPPARPPGSASRRRPGPRRRRAAGVGPRPRPRLPGTP